MLPRILFCLYAIHLLYALSPLAALTVLLIAVLPSVVTGLLAAGLGDREILIHFRTLGIFFEGRIRRRVRRALVVLAILACIVLVIQDTLLKLAGLDQLQALHRVAEWIASSCIFVVIVLVLPVPIIPVLLLLFRSVRRNVKTTYGTAHFDPIDGDYGDRGSAVAALLVRRPERSCASRGIVTPVWKFSTKIAYLSWETLSRHLLLVGNTGARKTTGVFTHLMLSARDIPWIYQDQKGELPLRSHFPNRPVWGLDTRGHKTRSAVWNPVDEIRGPEDAEVLAALLFPDRNDVNDWVYRGARHIFDSLLKSRRVDSLQALAHLVAQGEVDDLIASLPKGQAAALEDPRQRSIFLDALIEALKPWLSARIARITHGPSTVTLDRFIKEGGYVLANEGAKELRCAVTLFWGMLLHRLRTRPPGAAPLMLLLDEFGDAGRIPGIAHALALYRSKNVAIVAGVQTYSLMKTVYDKEWEAVRDGFGTVFVLTRNLPSEMYEPLTHQLGNATEEHLTLSSGSGGLSVSDGHVHSAPLVPVDQWPRWGAQSACLSRGHHPTWWIPVSVPLEPASLGPHEIGTDAGWREREAARVAALSPAASSEAVACQRCGAPFETGRMACSHCGISRFQETPEVF